MDRKGKGLILARKPKERVFLYTSSGEKIVVEVCDASPSRVVLAFAAPDSVRIVRSEIEEGYKR